MKPGLIVFDLDYTLWPFWLDTHVDPPFTMKSDRKVYDRNGRHVKYYPDVPEILDRLKKDGYTLAVASRTSCIEEAKQLLILFDWLKYFSFMEIYPGSKVTHFQRFQQQSRLPYSAMLFFDDEQRNITECKRLGVTCILAPGGVNWMVLQMGLQTFANS